MPGEQCPDLDVPAARRDSKGTAQDALAGCPTAATRRRSPCCPPSSPTRRGPATRRESPLDHQPRRSGCQTAALRVRGAEPDAELAHTPCPCRTCGKTKGAAEEAIIATDRRNRCEPPPPPGDRRSICRNSRAPESSTIEVAHGQTGREVGPRAVDEAANSASCATARARAARRWSPSESVNNQPVLRQPLCVTNVWYDYHCRCQPPTDHDARRRDVSRAVWRVLSRGGSEH